MTSSSHLLEYEQEGLPRRTENQQSKVCAPYAALRCSELARAEVDIDKWVERRIIMNSLV